MYSKSKQTAYPGHVRANFPPQRYHSRNHTGGSPAGPAAREALDWLCGEHLGRWLPVFLGRARQAAPPPMLGEVLNALEAWLAASLQRSLYEEA